MKENETPGNEWHPVKKRVGTIKHQEEENIYKRKCHLY